MAVSQVYTSPAVIITPIPTSLLRFPPDPHPATLPVPSGEPTFAHPFTIPPKIFNSLLSFQVPTITALIYVASVVLLNRYNVSRKNEPWQVSKTRAFQGFLIGHNIFLALFSAWTFAGLLNATRLSLDGVVAENGLVGLVDALCKINGPRGLGDAATFNHSTGSWSFTNPLMKLAANGLPNTTDVGRLWNGGLAFYGWLFYLSKFYEVVDTLIVLARGKESSFLQTYHHAGAMMCMWAGIRYMAPPIWMFVMVNSFIHTLMYSYYIATASKFKVPGRVKQLITTLQILQMIVGATFAFLHLIVAYTIPVSVPYMYSFADLTSSLSSDVSSAVTSTALASASAGLGSWLKKVAFRAAGEEGLAENVRNEAGEPFGVDAVHAATDLKTRQEVRYRDELRMVHCTDTSGEVSAILINCFYLAPLTWLFVRFFVRSYLQTGDQVTQGRIHRSSIEAAGKDIVKDMKRELGVSSEGKAEVQDGSSASKRGGDGSKGETEANVLDTAEAITDVLDKGVEPIKKSGKA